MAQYSRHGKTKAIQWVQRVFGALALLASSACQENESALAAQSGGAKGGGDASLQKTLAEPAPIGETELKIETLADGLVNPWSMAFLPDGSILVTEREGRLRIIRNGALEGEPIAGGPETLSWHQGGYFDILLHPDFSDNGVVYLSYAAGTHRANGTRIARATFDGERLDDLEVIYEAKPLKDTGHHFGGRMAWGGDGKLYMTIGEGARYKEKAQDVTTSFGAVVRLDEDGSIPADNPDFGRGARPELYSKGHRNPQGLAYDAERGILWEHEHGPRGGDEINIIKPGANYGWPLATYGVDYNGARITPFTEYEGTKQPVKYWTPSIAPSGLAVYEGDLFPEWNGDLLVGALHVQNGQALHRVIIEDGKATGEERYLVDLGERIRDVRVGPDGAIYVTTEERHGDPVGKVLRLTPQ